MISRYFIIFPFGCLGESNVYQNMVDFTSTQYFTWRESDCEEFVGLLKGKRSGVTQTDILVGQVGLEPTTGRL